MTEIIRLIVPIHLIGLALFAANFVIFAVEKPQRMLRYTSGFLVLAASLSIENPFGQKSEENKILRDIYQTMSPL